MIMIICEERGELRTLFDNEDSIPQYKLAILSFRSRFNADLNYYMVDCDSYIRYGIYTVEFVQERRLVLSSYLLTRI